ncbi:f18c9466-59c1-4a6e-891b-15973c221a81 [Thermothielavioides terrestris]|uniref:Uncharacterized protein n=2 Tax=Thermothielavioides terrestris TaxID=2587410 RepID=G2RD65_THETT|nr:uncharacterized protein THITE_2120664 [Thermothielavioides terrestris NRRL 8126]AEO69900.1 hypothetical protein THITE_2120664 [Thermothielavioides terrestris NRRL 8126]SPQ17695.1 f18c9466-59c1-4a6e-891b-15973c221a81 [Thermothielavioides terrestris]
MATGGFPYKHVLLIGATSGIGRALAERLLEENIQVTAVGRRQERLDELVRKHGADKAHAVAFDINQLDAIPKFAEDVTKQYPDIDSVFINAGVQRPADFSSPASVDLKEFHEQMHTNYAAAVSLAHAFLPFLLEKGETTPTSLIFTSSNLAIVPAVPIPAYSASKAALHVFAMCLRCQLAKKKNVKVIEVFPPAVQTELHDYLGPERGRNLGMPLDEFTAQAWQGLANGDDEVHVGFIGSKERFFALARGRREACEEFAVGPL